MPDPALEIQLADAHVTDIGDATLSQSVTAERIWLPRYEAADLQTVKVPVVAIGLGGLEQSSRTNADHRYDTQIGVLKRLGGAAAADPASDDGDEIADLMLLVQELRDALRNVSHELTTARASYIDIRQDIALDFDRLENDRTFFSVFTLTHLVIR